MKKSLEEIINEINEDYRNENGYYMSVYPETFALEVAKEVRKLTIIELKNLSQSKWIAGESGYLDKNLNLDLKHIQTW